MKKKLLIGAVVTGGAAFALRSLAPHVRKMHEHCNEMMAGGRDSVAAPCACGLSRETAVAH